MFITKVNKISIEKRELTERDCTSGDLEMLVAFQKRVRDCMKIRNNWRLFFAKDFAEILKKNDSIKLYYDGDTFVGFSILEVNHQRDLKKHRVEDLPGEQTAIVAGFMFAPEYWGNKLQQQLLCDMEETPRAKGLRYMLTMVAPSNKYSYDNFVNAKYRTIVDDMFIGGRRLILAKVL